MYHKLASNSDEQLLAEVARRKLDLHDKITDAVVRETYDFGKVIWRCVLHFSWNNLACQCDHF
jgi:hypothetical protein